MWEHDYYLCNTKYAIELATLDFSEMWEEVLMDQLDGSSNSID